MGEFCGDGKTVGGFVSNGARDGSGVVLTVVAPAIGTAVIEKSIVVYFFRFPPNGIVRVEQIVAAPWFERFQLERAL